MDQDRSTELASTTPGPVQLFIIHLWQSRSSKAGFRASVRAVSDDRSEFFTDADRLSRFLVDAAAHGAIAAPGDGNV